MGLEDELAASALEKQRAAQGAESSHSRTGGDEGDSRWTPQGWIYNRTTGSPAYFDMHIPKTGGSSFSRDIGAVLPAGAGYYSGEMCFDYRPQQMVAGDAQLAFLRQ